MRYSKWNKAICALLVVSTVAWCQNTGKIAGKVRDAKTSEPLPSVNIRLAGTALGASTDVRGEYFVANVPPGVYTVRASAVGYLPLTVNEVRVRSDATTDLNIQMTETVLEIGKEIVITAQRPLVEKDNTTTKALIESDEIAARPVTNLVGVLNALPSVDVVNGEMTIRGRALTEASVMIDGVRARNALDQTAYMNVNLSSIQDIEVVTGAFNAEYGEAQIGVINIVTKEGGEKYNFYTDFRYIPPGKKHWGVALYDYNTPLYWENTHARHQQWWIDYPDQWVDPNGYYGNDPRCTWTPEQSYDNYMATHQPLNDYTNKPGYDVESSFGGPMPFFDDMRFFVSGRYQSLAPTYGNAFKSPASFFDGTAKITLRLGTGAKLLLSGFLGKANTSWGVAGWPDFFYADAFGLKARYAYYDYPGYPQSQTDGISLKYSQVLDEGTIFEVTGLRQHAYRKVDVLPGDPVGWAASGATIKDYLRAVDASGNQIIGAYENPLGYNTNGYYNRNNDNNTEWGLTGYYQRQFNKYFMVRAGAEFSYYNLDHFNEAKAPDRVDSNMYHPYQGDAYVRGTLELGGLIMNIGLRYDFYQPNNVQYTNLWDPLNSPTVPTKYFSQLSPRLGVSHPIDEKTVLHFSYGHFFQRGRFADYGEGNSMSDALGSLTTFLERGSGAPSILGNRATKPQKTVTYELGIERNFAEDFVVGLTAYYSDITNTPRAVTVQAPVGIYKTNGNADYADVRGFEVYLRVIPVRHDWGSVFGNLSFRTQNRIDGRSGDPLVISPDQIQYDPGGDVVQPTNPFLKGVFAYASPSSSSFLAGVLNDVTLSVDFSMNFPNDRIFSDYFTYDGVNYMRPPNSVVNFRLSKELRLEGLMKFVAYMKVDNLLNEKWLNYGAFYRASPSEQAKFVQSDFKYQPQYDASGTPIFEMSKYTNLPRAISFGAIIEL